MRAELRMALTGCALALAAACGGEVEFARLHVREASRPPFVVELGARDLTLVEGLAVDARVSAIDEDGEPMPVLELQSEDPAVFDVARGPRLGHWVFVGVAPGEARVAVLSDGRRVGRLPVTVQTQPTGVEREATTDTGR